ncbi:efflux RND transporter periplasmic adaptor subunit [Chitinophaga sedimenti]|uniref:efflux RND transporter periplasmic adaptor subunit n=1 Tax=Chitinophaga sedimenti TaxID=2033606 RepID=UPI002003EF58|nr:efflux RND transporter periplasmic adaptor subunit [Chitinophaga sedimenti]MCK7553951.1 efflux RND transporter periplasmic adaptor subunit [Chitinophaga sedimenti]
MEPFVSIQNKTKLSAAFIAVALTIIAYSCGTTSADAPMAGGDAPVLPVVQLKALPAKSFREYTAAVEGKVNVEIRPQVDGYLDKIYVDEGAYVKQGQPLFRINDRPYQEQFSNAKASLEAAKANLEKAKLEVDRLSPLVANNVVSDVQLKTAQAQYSAAKAAVAQAQSSVGNAGINVGYTLISAPVSGYIGRIPLKIGSLVGRGEAQALTVISDVKEVYAYFSMSEVDFLHFKNDIAGETIADKIKNLPPVELVLADGSIYTGKGKIETVEGQFDKTMGAISFRAAFPNAQGLLRSGSTGKVRIPQDFPSTIVVPQEATFELQDKVFVFAVGDSNKVVSKPLSIAGKTTGYYFVGNSLKDGERIVYSGLGRLRDGAVIQPQPVQIDSLLRSRPL